MRKPLRFRPFRCTFRDKATKVRLRRVARVLRKFPHLQVEVEAQTASLGSNCTACHGCKDRKDRHITAPQLATCRAKAVQWYLRTHAATNQIKRITKPCMSQALGAVFTPLRE